MRSVSPALAAHLAGEVTTLATCWKITRRDGVEMGFTDHDADIEIGAINYKAATGFTASAIEAKSDFAVDNLDLEGMLSSDDITEADILAGVYDFAEVEIFVVNYQDLTQGDLYLKRGWLGEARVSRSKFVTELRGLSQKLSQKIGRVYAPSCDATLGQARCGVNMASYTFSALVTQATDRMRFAASALTQEDGYFAGGEVEWTSGANDGLRMEIKEFSGGEVVLVLPMPNEIAVSDGLNVKAGCDKTRDTCKAKFDNLLNFRGFPAIPGMDKILETAGTFERE